MSQTISANDIAVIGMACRLPDAVTPDEFWANVRAGVESVRPLSEEELRRAGVDSALLRNPDYVRAGVVLEGMDRFDAGFFGFSPREAAIMDPQHRVFLECAWEALEDAGHAPESFDGRAGVFGGCGMGAYLLYNLATNKALMDSVGMFLVRHTGNDKDFLTTRVSYQFDLRGPSISVQTACSTSLVAIHMAAQSLLAGECDLALAGGVTIEIPHGHGYVYQEGEILAKDGHCRPFDANSTGTIFGSGAGVVVLRRLEEAIEAGDRVYAVLKGSAINNDGSTKVGYLAPSVDGQAKAIAEAIAVAGVSAASIGYVEAHGTGTAVGDPIEISALTRAFRESTASRGFCATGSVKANIGHLDTAAGVASFIKVVQALRHRELPPSINFSRPNPLIDFDASPFFVNTAVKPWESGAEPRRAGVSSLGVGGTNAHAILEEAPPAATDPPRRRWEVIPLSARTPDALESAAERWAAHLKTLDRGAFADAAFTAQTGRRRFAQRRVVVAENGAEAAELLTRRDAKRIFTHGAGAGKPRIVFAFPGGGAQYPNMGRGLYESESVFRDGVDACLAYCDSRLDFRLRERMFPDAERLGWAAEQLQRPLNSILSVFTVEYALAKLWMSWGIQPAALTGHSLGEYTAATLAGVLTLEDALALVIARGEVFERMPEGGMVNVALPEAEIRPLLGRDLALAAINGESSCVVSGDSRRIAELQTELEARDVECSRLHISVAAHSPLLEPFLGEFEKVCARIRMGAPSIPCISNLTGTWLRAGDLNDTYWVRHLRGTVRFHDGLKELLREPECVVVETGPGTALTSLIRVVANGANQHAAASMRHPKESVADEAVIATALGKLWALGADIDWKAYRGGERRTKATAPTYPFERKRYWIDAGQVAYAAPTPEPVSEPASLKQASMDDWFWRPAWRRADGTPAAADGAARPCMILSNGAIGEELSRLLRGRGIPVVRVLSGERFAAEAEDEYRVAPTNAADWRSLLASLIDANRVPAAIVDLWPAETYGRSNVGAAERIFWAPIEMIRTFAAEDSAEDLDLLLVTRCAQSVAGDETVDPFQALAAGPAKAIPSEYPGIRTRWIDLGMPGAGEAAMLAAELDRQADSATVAAYRGGARWVEEWERLPAAQRSGDAFRDGGVYVLTGGFGGMALAIARGLASKHKARIALIHRAEVPPRDRWHLPCAADAARRISAIRELENLGSEVMEIRGDATDATAMTSAFSEIGRRWKHIDGVIHTAGAIRDGVIQEKAFRDAADVLAPKVQGALALEAAFAAAKPDFAVLCSSTSALLGLAGQVDYTAANAFLDAYARRKRDDGVRMLAINWGVWNGVGMAAKAALPGEEIFAKPMSPARDWFLAEHRLRGGAFVLPGASYIDLALSAARASDPARQWELRNLFFTKPLMFESEGEDRIVSVVADRREERIALRVVSRASSSSRATVHAEAELSPSTAEARRYDPERLAAERGLEPADPVRHPPECQQRAIEFGPRWRNVRRLWTGSEEVLAELELPPGLGGDLEAHEAHPALLDIATSAGLFLLAAKAEDGGFYVPLSYGRVTAFRTLPSRLFAHARSVQRESERGVAVFDAVLMDAFGLEAMRIEGFAMRRISRAELTTQEPAAPSAKRTGAAGRLAEWLEAGIEPEEGFLALERALSASGERQVVATSIDLKELLRETRPKPALSPRPAAGGGLSSDPVEAELQQIWRELLGADSVSVDDDFFDLGGHSLIAVRLFNKIKRIYKAELGLATLFEARTIRQLAAAVREATGESASPRAFSCLVPLRKEGSKPILFCLHGVGGNVLGYRDLVNALPPDQPFYAIQSRGLSREAPPSTDMKEIAADYIREILAMQPEGPYYLSGYSFGGVAAFEMAQQLTAAGHRVAFLALFDTDRPNVDLPFTERLLANAKHIASLSGEARTKYLRRKYENVSAALRRRLFPRKVRAKAGPSESGRVPDVREANFKAYLAYHAQPYQGRLTIFQGSELGDSGYRKPKLGWESVALGGIDLHPIPGNHMTILYEPCVSELGRKLTACLDQVYAAEAETRAVGETLEEVAAP